VSPSSSRTELYAILVSDVVYFASTRTSSRSSTSRINELVSQRPPVSLGLLLQIVDFFVHLLPSLHTLDFAVDEEVKAEIEK